MSENDNVVEHDAFIFTNRAEDPGLRMVLDMFCQAAVNNQIGVMRSYNTATEKEEVVLVGVHMQDGVPAVFPVAKALEHTEVDGYLMPDGKGGWSGERVEVDDHVH